MKKKGNITNIHETIVYSLLHRKFKKKDHTVMNNSFKRIGVILTFVKLFINT